MSQIIIDTGNVANDGTGSTLRQAFADVNNMFTEVYNAGPVSSNVSIANNTIATTLLNSNLILAPSGIGNIQANSRIVPGFNDVYDIGSPDKRWNTIYVGTGGLDIQGGLNFGGNVSANYFIGNGSQLTGIVAESSNQIANGTSNVNISSANGVVTVSVNGTANVAAFTQAAFYIETDIVANGAVSASGNLIGNYILGNGALLSGIPGGTRIANGTSNVAITSSGGNVSISVGGVDDVALFTPTDIQLKGNLDILGTIVAPGLNFESGNLAVIGNISASYFLGNGSLLTGISSDISKKIANGTSNVNIATANGNVTMSVGGVSNIATITTGGISVAGQISATGNIVGGYFVGNGALLTGISGGTRLVSGTSNVVIESPGGNVTVSVGGVDDVAVFTPTDIQLKGNVGILGSVVAPGFDLENGNLALSGNISASYFTGNGSLLTGLSSDISKKIANGTSNVNIATASGNVTVGVGGVSNVATITTSGISVTGQISTTGQISAGGNVTGAYFVGNGRQLTGITSGSRIASGTSNVAIDSPNGNVTVSVGGVDDVALFTSTSVQLKGNVGILGNIVAPGLAFESGNLALSGNVTAQYFIGNGGALTGISSDISKKIANGTSNVNIATASGNVTVGVGGVSNVATITTGGVNIAGQLNTTGQISASGNITGGYFVGNGRQLTGITSGSRIASGNSNVVVESTNGDVTIGVDGVSNVAVFTPTDIQLKGDLDILGTIVAPGLAFESGNLSVIGNISADYYTGNGRYLTGIVATGLHEIANGTSNVNIPIGSGNVTVSVGGVSNVATFTTTGQNLAGSLSASGNVTANIITANTFVGNISGNIQAPGANTQILFNDNNVTNAVSGFTFDKTSNAVSISGNVDGAYFTGNGVGLTSTLVDQGGDPNNWDTNLKMGVYTVNRASWSGTTGAPLDSQVFVGLLEVTNSTNMSASQVFYPGAVTAGDVMIQWNRNYFNGVWTGWVKVINDDQIVHGGDF